VEVYSPVKISPSLITLQIFTDNRANCLYFILPELVLMNIIRCSLPNFGNEIRW
jgi:hypothetical protein